MRLSKNFTLEELTESATANRLYIENTPTEQEIKNLKLLCENILQKVRRYIAAPVVITSGFRNNDLNAAIGGATLSQHKLGEAVDFKCNYLKDIFHFIKDTLDFDQIIYEYGDADAPRWIHVSYKKTGNRRQALMAYKKGYKTVYEEFSNDRLIEINKT